MTSLLNRLRGLRSVPPHIIVVTALASYAGQVFASLEGWPLWARVLATAVPWGPLATYEMAWTYRHYQWFALLYVLVITQLGHVGEHLSQMYQIHVLHRKGLDARGVFGALDIEWVHFAWNTFIILAVAALIVRFFTRADLHFLYNVIETTPLLIAFVYQLRRTYDEWLAKVFPDVPESVLADATTRLISVSVKPGEAVVRQGEPADRFFIVVSGELEVVVGGELGMRVATRGPGDFFGEVGLLAGVPRTATVRAVSPAELLALDRETFRRVVEHSEKTGEELAHLARQRLAAT